MNPSAIYSKSGKGVQEASGKTSLLKRAERAVLSAIDGRATLSEVAKKVGKPFDATFTALIAQLDRDGFVREVSGIGAAAAPTPAARPAAKPAAPKAVPAAGEDLDFTGIMTSPLKAPAKPAVDADAAKRAREQEAALNKARQEAEARAQQERDKARAEAEAKFRAETEKRLIEEAQAKAKAKAEAEVKAKAEAEAKAKIEAERRAREEAERKAKEVAEKARREAEELRQRLEEERKAREDAERRAREEAERKAREEAERKAREEAERKAREEAEKARREAEELRQRLEEERKAREEAERRAKEAAEKARAEAERKAREEAERKAREEAERKAREEAERKAREEAERKAREEAERKAREEAERKAREEAERKAREEAERRAREEAEAQMRRAREEAERKRAEAERKDAQERERREAETRKVPAIPAPLPPEPQAPEPQLAKPAEGDGGLDALMADLDSFNERDDEERKAREEAENQEREARKRKLHDEGEQREREQAEERERREAEERQRQEEARREEERRAREDAQRRAREEEEERARRAAEEQARVAREALAAQGSQDDDDIGITPSDLDMDDVRRDEAAVAKESRKARREREREARRLEKEARERARAAERAAAKAAKSPKAAAKVQRPRRRRNWARTFAVALLVLLVAGLGLLHVVPVPTDEYQRAVSEALRQPVRIGGARLSLLRGLELKLSDLTIGSGTRIAAARAYPKLGSLFGDAKAFSRIELDGVTLRQESLAESLSARAAGRHFTVDRIVVTNLRLEGPVRLPALEADLRLTGDGTVRTVLLRGPEGLMGQLMPKGQTVDFEVTAGSFALPFAPEVSLSSFAMKGRANRQGMYIESWGGSLLGGAVSGTANLRWGGTWALDGVLTVRGINAAVFAPALLSEGNAEGTGKFSMSGADPAKLVRAGRVEGSFSIGKGVLGSFDLSRAIRTDGREVNGRTQFVELNAQGIYDRGSVALRNVVIGAGALQAGASADISQSGALSGRIVADVRTAQQSLRATLLLGGTVKEPQVRN